MEHMQGQEESRDAPARRWARRLGWTLAAAAALSGAAALTAVALVKPLDHDEQMYVAAGALLARGVGWPYRDFPFYQMPGLPLVYAPLFAVTDRLLLVARLVNSTAFCLALASLFALAWRRWRPAGPVAAALAGAAGVLLVAGSGPVTWAFGLAWNHDLPVLLLVLAVAAFTWGPGRPLLAGALVGLAITLRLAFVPAVLPFGLIALVPDAAVPAPAGRRAALRPAGHLLAGLVVGLSPALVLAALAPGGFLFDNVTFHLWNAVYWQQAGNTATATLPGKLDYVWALVVSQAPALALLILYAVGGALPLAWALARGRLRAHRDLALAALLAPCLLAGALVPTPTWYQYFYAPVPFLVLAAVLGLAATAGRRAVPIAARAGALGALALGAVLALGNGVGIYGGYLGQADPWQPATWVPMQVQAAAASIRAAGPAGRPDTDPHAALPARGQAADRPRPGRRAVRLARGALRAARHRRCRPDRRPHCVARHAWPALRPRPSSPAPNGAWRPR